MLEEVEADYQQRIVEYGPHMKSEEYLAINPMGKVPAIKHGSRVITECAAICAYLADTFPKFDLAPPREQRADYYRWMFFAAGPLEAAITNRSLGFNVTEEQQRMAGYGAYGQVIDVLETFLNERQYVCGDKFTAADVYLGSHIDFGMQFGSIEERDSFHFYANRLRGRPAYKVAKQKDAELMPQS